MIRITSYAACIAALVWLASGSLRFHYSIRTSLREAYSLLGRLDPVHAADNGKVLNGYYEDVYRNLPDVITPGCVLMLASTVLFLSGRSRKAEPHVASPEGDPAARRGNSNITEGPPPVS